MDVGGLPKHSSNWLFISLVAMRQIRIGRGLLSLANTSTDDQRTTSAGAASAYWADEM